RDDVLERNLGAPGNGPDLGEEGRVVALDLGSEVPRDLARPLPGDALLQEGRAVYCDASLHVIAGLAPVGEADVLGAACKVEKREVVGGGLGVWHAGFLAEGPGDRCI